MRVSVFKIVVCLLVRELVEAGYGRTKICPMILSSYWADNNWPVTNAAVASCLRCESVNHDCFIGARVSEGRVSVQYVGRA
jgi:hypothetical protein